MINIIIPKYHVGDIIYTIEWDFESQVYEVHAREVKQISISRLITKDEIKDGIHYTDEPYLHLHNRAEEDYFPSREEAQVVCDHLNKDNRRSKIANAKEKIRIASLALQEEGEDVTVSYSKTI